MNSNDSITCNKSRNLKLQDWAKICIPLAFPLGTKASRRHLQNSEIRDTILVEHSATKTAILLQAWHRLQGSTEWAGPVAKSPRLLMSWCIQLGKMINSLHSKHLLFLSYFLVVLSVSGIFYVGAMRVVDRVPSCGCESVLINALLRGCPSSSSRLPLALFCEKWFLNSFDISRGDL